jgi:hypothetical protein
MQNSTAEDARAQRNRKKFRKFDDRALTALTVVKLSALCVLCGKTTLADC